NDRIEERTILEGDIRIEWDGSTDPPAVARIDASGIEIRGRKRAAPFVLVLDEAILPPEGSYFIDPLIVWDLNHDGKSEIILAAKNRILRQGESGSWGGLPLCAHDPGLI